MAAPLVIGAKPACSYIEANRGIRADTERAHRWSQFTGPASGYVHWDVVAARSPLIAQPRHIRACGEVNEGRSAEATSTGSKPFGGQNSGEPVIHRSGTTGRSSAATHQDDGRPR
jgi:hypothetical protein